MHKPSLGECLSVLKKTKFGMAIFWPLRTEPFMHAEQLQRDQLSAGDNARREGSNGFPTLKAAHWKLGKHWFVN